MKPEEILLKDPKPIRKNRYFSGKRMAGFSGYVHVDKVKGWVDNPRIALEIRKDKVKFGDRAITQDEIFEIMKRTKDVKLAALRDDVLRNELKEPIILSKDGTLLDGNRRFFAVKLLLEGLKPGHPDRKDFEKIPCYILDASTTEDDEKMVLVETNFTAAHKIEWPDYVKAEAIQEDYQDGLSIKELSTKYQWTQSKIRETLKILELADEFQTLATDEIDDADPEAGGFGMTEMEAIAFVSEKYQHFNEAQRSLKGKLGKDHEFTHNFFRLLKDGIFASFQEVRSADEMWDHAEARAVLLSGNPSAAKEALTVVNSAKRVINIKEKAEDKVADVIKTLRKLTSEEMDSLKAESVAELKEVLKLVTDMSLAAKD